jgi:diguanylate cyclase (GGDEF)-like protein
MEDKVRRWQRNLQRAISFALSLLRPLPEEAERELAAQHDSEIGQLLPMMGPLFGLGVLLFSVWDSMIDPQHAWLALAVRLLLVLAGAVAYFPGRIHWTPIQRWGVIYATHASAIILCEFLLTDGFLYGLAGIAACVFAVPVATLRARTFLLILAIPTLLFVVLSAASMTRLGFVNNLMLYFFSVSLAYFLMLAIRSFRQKAFLFEKELLHVSRHDSLTGACNRRYLTELAEREIALARRHQRALAVAMLDIDHFKFVNDTYGHDIGDRVLKLLVNACVDNLRMIDHIGRIGGEEFVCILPETGEAEALLCAERLRRAIEALRVETPQGFMQFTVSIGVALLRPDHADWSAVLKDADTALYCAKREGRNQVVLAASHLAQPGQQ